MNLPQQKRIDVRSYMVDGKCHVELLAEHKHISLTEAVYFLYQQFLLKNNLIAIQRQFHSHFKQAISRAQLEQVLTQLQQHGLFESQRSRNIRAIAFKEALSGNVLWLNTATPQPKTSHVTHRIREHSRHHTLQVDGLLLPHGHWSLCGHQHQKVFGHFNADNWPDVFVICATSHYEAQPSILQYDVRTPSGLAHGHKALAHIICDQFPSPFSVNSPVFLFEHSWQTFLPSLITTGQSINRHTCVLPILMGDLSFEQGRQLGHFLKQSTLAYGLRICLIASGDLTHYGASYAWQAPFATSGKAIDRQTVAHNIGLFEKPILQAIGRRDITTVKQQLVTTSFCARSQLAALISFANFNGTPLHHESFVNFKRNSRQHLKQTWQPTDCLYSTSTMIFADSTRLPPATTLPETKQIESQQYGLCHRIFYQFAGDHIKALHECNHQTVVIPTALWQKVKAIRTRLLPATPCSDPLTSFFTRSGWIHPPLNETGPSPFLATKLQHCLAHSANTIPYYQRKLHADCDISHQPILTKALLQRHWPDFNSQPMKIDHKHRNIHQRYSSASTNSKALLSVVEKDVYKQRTIAAKVINPFSECKPVANFNRYNNLFTAQHRRVIWPAHQRRGSALRIAPGHNPTLLTPDCLDRSIELLIKFRPRYLHGSPDYLFELAKRMLTHRVILTDLTEVNCGHTYLWSNYKHMLSQAFNTTITVRYHCSEIGDIAYSCPAGQLHLLEHNMYFEIIKAGYPAKLGETGLLMATTLDTQLRPLIRYQLGDVVKNLGYPCQCRRPFRAIQFLGRMETMIPRPPMEMASFADVDDIIRVYPELGHFQLVILNRARAVMNIQHMHLMSPARAHELTAQLGQLLHRSIQAKPCNALTVAPGGKLQNIVIKK